MVAPSRDDRSVDALVKSKAVLDVLAELGPSTAKTISERTGEPVSSTYRLLDNLAAVGWVERGINRGEYRLGIEVVPELLRTLVFARPCGGDQFAAGTVSPSLDMSR